MSIGRSGVIAAATLVLFRKGEGAPGLLFVERSRAMVFASGALVFPGGRIDPGDRALAHQLGGEPDDMAARIAAIRETVEEVGVPVGLPPIASDVLAGLRAALHGGAAFGVALADLGLTLDPFVLTPFARWCPAHAHVRVFDTRFYLACLPADAPDPVVDDTENVRVFWSAAQAVLDEADAGRATIVFPTRRNLERLARYASFEDAVADTARHPIRAVMPWIEDRDGEPYLCIPDDLGYPVTSEPMMAVVRG